MAPFDDNIDKHSVQPVKASGLEVDQNMVVYYCAPYDNGALLKALKLYSHTNIIAQRY